MMILIPLIVRDKVMTSEGSIKMSSTTVLSDLSTINLLNLTMLLYPLNIVQDQSLNES